jgi:hypothetical protein
MIDMSHRARRFLFFGLAILVGIAAGVIYGWVINPVEYVNTGPHTLRIDYQTDYVLMVAELYQAENDIYAAVERLVFLGDQSPVDLVNQAILFAGRNGYAPADIEDMWDLAEALKIVLPESE